MFDHPAKCARTMLDVVNIALVLALAFSIGLEREACWFAAENLMIGATESAIA